MEKEFVPYEPALELKELGFDESCFYQYVRDFDNDGELIPITSETNYPILRDNTQVSLCSGGECFAAPLYQQAFRWFREKHELDSFVKHLYKSKIKVGYYFGIDEYKGIEFQMDLDGYYNTYEEAELERLKKLIEIVKSK